MTGASGYDRETSLRIHSSETGLVPCAATLWIQSSVGTLLALLPSFPSPPHVLSICPSTLYHIQASYLLHDGGLRWEKGQLAAAQGGFCVVHDGRKEHIQRKMKSFQESGS